MTPTLSKRKTPDAAILPEARGTAPIRLAGFGWPDASFLTTLVAVCGLTAWVGAAPLRLFQQDIFFLLDGGYRVLQGQVPHRDFSSAWGPITYLVEAGGLLLSGMRPAGVGYASAVFGAMVAAWAYMIGRARFSSGKALLLGIYTLLLMTAPFSLGWGALNFSHAMVYNRYGYALLGIVLVECATHIGHRNLTRRQAALGALSTGVAFALLLFLKVSYAIMALPFILAAGFFGSSRRRRFAVFSAGFGIVALLIICYLRFDLSDMFRDLAMAASGRSRSWRPREIFSLGFGQLAEIVPLLLLAFVAGSKKNAESRRGMAGPSGVYLLAAVTLAVGGVLLSTNHQPSGLPLNGFAAIVLLDTLRIRVEEERESSPIPQTHHLLAWFLTCLCVVPLCAISGISLAAAAAEESRPQEASTPRLACDRGSSILFGAVPAVMTTETGGPAYVQAANDGLEILRRHTGSRDGVLTIDMLNPFNYLLDRPSPRGGFTAAAYNYMFSDAVHLSADQFLGDTRYVLVRNYSRTAGDYSIENSHIQGLERIYGPALRERFDLIEETPHWSLYRLRQTSKQPNT